MKNKLQSVMDRIKKAAVSSGRNPETVRLVAVSKTIPSETVRKAIDAGAEILGENYIQEARTKFNDLSSYPVSWHFIGHLQTNKAKYAVRIFDLIHSVDSFKLALELDKQAKKTGKIQHVLIQVNISDESSKSGISLQDTLKLVKEISVLNNLAIKGLMTMPPFFNAPEKVRPFFKNLRSLRDQISKEDIDNVAIDELSMGMTGDFEVAIEEGATLVRIGTAIFGERI
ncbi:MAG: YggS family pyridoxal phosphate enzyme [Desulfobacteraceae bacterium 4572_187]|nr:MAG: YggS family pyridoxal phosphate enzyme [Desulfobacteraceae bacterium 4572_187]